MRWNATIATGKESFRFIKIKERSQWNHSVNICVPPVWGPPRATFETARAVRQPCRFPTDKALAWIAEVAVLALQHVRHRSIRCL